MKQDYTLYIYKLDRRCKTGERLFSTTVWRDKTEQMMQGEVRELMLTGLYPASEFRMVFHPVMKTVKNLMTGADVTIEADTPRCCDPSSELYWSM